jgi:hypothetical protein
MKPITIFGLMIITLLLAGCEKNTLDALGNDGKIREILNGSEETIGKFRYNSDGNLKENWLKEEFYTLGEKAEYTYTYDSENRLAQKTGYEPGIIFMSSFTGAMGKNVVYSYEYNSEGKMQKVTVDYDYESEKVMNFSRQTVYEYSNDDVIVETPLINDPAANYVAGYTEFHFNSDGNIETIDYYSHVDGEDRLITETVMLYDKNPAPYNPEPVPTSKNNMLSKTITNYNYNENENRSIVYTYEYTYNSDGFPDSQIETLPNEIEITKYFKY